MAKASCAAWKVIGTVTAPPETVRVWLRTTCGALSGAWSGIRSTTTLTVPPPASHDTDDSPLNVTVAAPVYPLLSPMTATARLAVASSAAEMAVDPTCPEVATRVPVRSAYVRSAHQLPLACQLPPLWVSTP